MDTLPTSLVPVEYTQPYVADPIFVGGSETGKFDDCAFMYVTVEVVSSVELTNLSLPTVGELTTPEF